MPPIGIQKFNGGENPDGNLERKLKNTHVGFNSKAYY